MRPSRWLGDFDNLLSTRGGEVVLEPGKRSGYVVVDAARVSRVLIIDTSVSMVSSATSLASGFSEHWE